MICICSDGPVEAAAKASVGTRPTIGGMAKFRHWFYEMEWSKNSYGKVYFLWFRFFVQAKKWTEKEAKPILTTPAFGHPSSKKGGDH